MKYFEISEEATVHWGLKANAVVHPDERSDVGLMFLSWVRKTTDWNGKDPILITGRDW